MKHSDVPPTLIFAMSPPLFPTIPPIPQASFAVSISVICGSSSFLAQTDSRISPKVVCSTGAYCGPRAVAIASCQNSEDASDLCPPELKVRTPAHTKATRVVCLV